MECITGIRAQVISQKNRTSLKLFTCFKTTVVTSVSVENGGRDYTKTLNLI
jgi:hypothetical protein